MNDTVPLRLYMVIDPPAYASGGLVQAANAVKSAGRGGDEILVHVNKAEFDQIRKHWGEPSINPHTGLPEYGFFKKLWHKVKKVVKKVAPYAGIAAAIFMPALAPAIGGALGASGAAATAIGNAVIGGVSGGITGGKKGLLSGALMGGAGSYASKIGGAMGLQGPLARIAGNSLVSGAGSKIRGGSFGQGMTSGAISAAMAPTISGKIGSMAKSMGINTPGINSQGLTNADDASLGGGDGTGGGAGGDGLEEFDMSQIPDKLPVASNVDFNPEGGIEPTFQNPDLTPDDSILNADIQPYQPGIMGTINKGIDWAKANPGKTAAAIVALNMLGGKGGGSKPKKPGMPEGWDTPLPQVQFNRRQTLPQGGYYTYGQAPEQSFFSGNGFSGYSQGGSTGRGNLGQVARYVREHTGAPGRADNIDAKLSEGEYVIDAETVALLGDGSSDAGAAKLDQLRSNIRRHKGAKLAKGKISPNARSAEAYLGGK